MKKVADNILRQYKGLKLLAKLLQEEFEQLQDHSRGDLATQELSIQELIRQLAVEKTELKGLLQAMQPAVAGLQELEANLSGRQKQFVQESRQKLSFWEEKCQQQARTNSDLCLALLDQNNELLSFLHKQVKQQAREVYGKTGSWSEVGDMGPNVIQGRL